MAMTMQSNRSGNHGPNPGTGNGTGSSPETGFSVSCLRLPILVEEVTENATSQAVPYKPPARHLHAYLALKVLSSLGWR
jgi:hypothetical protein